MAQQTEETVSVSLTAAEINLILGTFEDTTFDDETEVEDGEGETVEIESEEQIAEGITTKLQAAKQQFPHDKEPA